MTQIGYNCVALGRQILQRRRAGAVASATAIVRSGRRSRWTTSASKPGLNALIREPQAKVFELPYRFNRDDDCMDVLRRAAFRFYFLHYAGITSGMPESEQLEADAD